MGILRQGLMACLALAAPVVLAQARPAQPWQGAGQWSIQPEARQLVELANEARAAQGAGQLKWDPALAAAARKHCLRMAAEGSISHRYSGEPEVSERAGEAGAHFNLIEENVAIAPTPAAIHDAWMHSPGHRTNLLNPRVDRVGVAVVASRIGLYAVADYARAVPVLTQAQVEGTIAGLLRANRVAVLPDATLARAACAVEHGMPRASSGPQPRFMMRWQEAAALTRLPDALLDRLATGRYRQAAVGSCPAQDMEGSFTAYRMAVLLY
ncbi:MAG: CAP domain-containing protein [Terracidiphilus sp.]|jgi:hypothetical protein